MPGNYAIFVLAPNGDIIDAHVMDGVVPIGVETGLMKAKTALYARSTVARGGRALPDVEGRLIRTDLGREQGLSYYFVGRRRARSCVEDQLIGAIGVGGGNMDEPCAYAALTKVLGPQPPLPPPSAPRRWRRRRWAAGRGGRGQ